ncbi:hypothetical protein A3K24_00665 [candidate division Kazan bacterium RIFCSPHIGHO2_01_FULL_44_14]|uniref:Permease n=1 Tax=candidate division Kazan bacterium RIFCSPLOWO2_01_FULL_45_19 TaxID=1798538 RepID=A0A1F4NQ09_UNCK3|nr:MAG: hypothetical protein A3K51_00665 [candidate division Kazan bacterium RIFCSPLOWO2_01_FULL_45_19]OGB77622.1 MAG: hypothetical protein A3K24_00665 [candidate division Kazan bacterium RIFCSPHIGHO2_01_FULL_44_14]
MLILSAVLAFLSTLLGGWLALRFKDKLHLILGFSAGAVIGVAFFDLIPEAQLIGQQFYSVATIASFIGAGFLAYLLLDRWVLLHYHNESSDNHHHASSRRGILGGSTLSVHSFLDGLAIGVGFQVSSAVGIVVAVAVLTHDFSDGINTISVLLKNSKDSSLAFKWLLVDAIAPVLGIVATLFFTLPESMLGILLAIFAGFFLYVGASDLIPESHHAHPKFLTTLMTLFGAGTLFLVVRLAGL